MALTEAENFPEPALAALVALVALAVTGVVGVVGVGVLVVLVAPVVTGPAGFAVRVPPPVLYGLGVVGEPAVEGIIRPVDAGPARPARAGCRGGDEATSDEQLNEQPSGADSRA